MFVERLQSGIGQVRCRHCMCSRKPQIQCELGSPCKSIGPRRKLDYNTRSMVEVSNRRDLHALYPSEKKEYAPRRLGNGRDSPTDLLLNRSGKKHGRQEGSELKKGMNVVSTIGIILIAVLNILRGGGITRYFIS